MTQAEDKARENIDRMLTKSGWAVRDQKDAHVSADRAERLTELVAAKAFKIQDLTSICFTSICSDLVIEHTRVREYRVN